MELVGPCWSRHNSGPCKSTVGITVLQHPPTLTQHRSGNSEPGEVPPRAGGAVGRRRRALGRLPTRKKSGLWISTFAPNAKSKAKSDFLRLPHVMMFTRGRLKVPVSYLRRVWYLLASCWTLVGPDVTRSNTAPATPRIPPVEWLLAIVGLLLGGQCSNMLQCLISSNRGLTVVRQAPPGTLSSRSHPTNRFRDG